MRDFETRAFMRYLLEVRENPRTDIRRMERLAEHAMDARRRQRRETLQREEEEAVAVAEAAIRLRQTAPVRRPRTRVVYNEGVPMYPDEDANFNLGIGEFIPPVLDPPGARAPWFPGIWQADDEELALRAAEQAELEQVFAEHEAFLNEMDEL